MVNKCKESDIKRNDNAILTEKNGMIWTAVQYRECQIEADVNKKNVEIIQQNSLNHITKGFFLCFKRQYRVWFPLDAVQAWTRQCIHVIIWARKHWDKAVCSSLWPQVRVRAKFGWSIFYSIHGCQVCAATRYVDDGVGDRPGQANPKW